MDSSCWNECRRCCHNTNYDICGVNRFGDTFSHYKRSWWYFLFCFSVTTNYWICLMVEGIIGFSNMLSIAQTFGIVGTMVLTLIFSRSQLQSLSIHDQTRVLNDLDEKVRKMAEIIIEKPSMQKVIYKLEKP